MRYYARDGRRCSGKDQGRRRPGGTVGHQHHRTATSGTYSAIHNNRKNGLFADFDVDHGGDLGRHTLTNTAADCTIRGGTYISDSHAVVKGENGTLIEDIIARSQQEEPGLQILESAENITLKNNDIEGGIEDER